MCYEFFSTISRLLLKCFPPIVEKNFRRIFSFYIEEEPEHFVMFRPFALPVSLFKYLDSLMDFCKIYLTESLKDPHRNCFIKSIDAQVCVLF